MKYFISTLCAFSILVSVVIGQVPNYFSYQAIARDASGSCLSNQVISLRMSVIDDSIANNPIYQEVFSNVNTNDVGHFRVLIGQGVKQGNSPDFSELNWNLNGQSRHLKVELSSNNDLNFQEVGMTQLMTVPYAKAAGNGLMNRNNTENDEILLWHGTNGNRNGVLEGLVDVNGERNYGRIALFDENGESKVQVRASPNNSLESSGALYLYGDNGNFNTIIGASGDQNHGIMTFRNQDGNTRLSIFSENDWGGAGRIITNGPNSQRNIEFSVQTATNTIGHNRGALRIYDENGDQKVYVGVDGNGNGTIIADGANGGVKNFIMDHPKLKDVQIAYASLEGPEAAAYTRGTTKLINGEATIQFPEHFQIVANLSTMTIMASPSSADSKGLAIIEKTATGFKVKEMWNGKGNYSFDWEVKAVRKGWEDYKVIRDKVVELDDVEFDLGKTK